jgi:lincosamide nucleotidyltransferase A/C/D/E
VRADEVTDLMSALDAAGIRAWVAGGWAVDILVGRQTRPHNDLDLAIDAAQLPQLLALLDGDGFTLSVDAFPSRAELTARDGRILDLHPVEFDSAGAGVQQGLDGGTFRYAADGFTRGTLAGTEVSCLSARQQLVFRRGYRLRPVDHHDIALLERVMSSDA